MQNNVFLRLAQERYTTKHIRDFMKVIIRHLPSPAEANDALFIKRDGTPFKTYPDKNLPLIAQVFKIVNDPFIGKIGVWCKRGFFSI